MADRRNCRNAGRLSRRAYTLQPARPFGLRLTIWATVCLLSAAAGGAVVTAWYAQGTRQADEACTPTAVDDDSKQTDLARARLALAEESAARAAVQKSADSAAAEVARLGSELQFLRGQSKGRAPAATPQR